MDVTEAKDRDSACVKELGKRASRKGNLLTLKLGNGATKTFRSDPEACKKDDAVKCMEYYLLAFYPAYSTAGAYLVYGHGYEGHEYTLVNARTGKTATTEGIPRLAPDKSTYFVKDCEESGCWMSIGSSASSASPAWKLESEEAADWDFVRWIDNDQVALRSAQPGKRCPRGNCEAVLKRAAGSTAGSWAIEELPAK